MSTLSEDYLEAYGGAADEFVPRLARERVGQAFFNCLSRADRDILRGTAYDPFFSNRQTDVYKAIEFLLVKNA